MDFSDEIGSNDNAKWEANWLYQDIPIDEDVVGFYG